MAKMAIAARIWVKKTRLNKYFRKLIKNFNLHKDIKKDAGCRLSVVRNKKNVQNSPDERDILFRIGRSIA